MILRSGKVFPIHAQQVKGKIILFAQIMHNVTLDTSTILESEEGISDSGHIAIKCQTSAQVSLNLL